MQVHHKYMYKKKKDEEEEEDINGLGKAPWLWEADLNRQPASAGRPRLLCFPPASHELSLVVTPWNYGSTFSFPLLMVTGPTGQGC